MPTSHPFSTVAELQALLGELSPSTMVFVGWTETHDVDSLQHPALVAYPAEADDEAFVALQPATAR